MVLPYNFCFIKLLPSLTVEAVDAPDTLFQGPLTPGFGVQGRNHAKNLSAIKIYSYAKFHQDRSDSLDFYRVRIYIYIFCALYIRYPGPTIFLEKEPCYLMQEVKNCQLTR